MNYTKRLMLAIVLLSGCSVADANLVTSSRAFLDAVGPEYRTYVEEDWHLTSEERENRFRTLRAHDWELTQYEVLLLEQDSE